MSIECNQNCMKV